MDEEALNLNGLKRSNSLLLLYSQSSDLCSFLAKVFLVLQFSFSPTGGKLECGSTVFQTIGRDSDPEL